jgi:hypothetical protein
VKSPRGLRTKDVAKVWKAMIEVVPGSDNRRHGSVAAFTNGVVFAETVTTAGRRMSSALEVHGYSVVRINEIKEVSWQPGCAPSDDDISVAARRARRTGRAQFGRFFFWRH